MTRAKHVTRSIYKTDKLFIGTHDLNMIKQNDILRFKSLTVPSAEETASSVAIKAEPRETVTDIKVINPYPAE